MTKHEIDCEEALRRLFDFLDHELGEQEREEVQRHLSTCRTCYSRASFEEQLMHKLRELAQDESTPAGARLKRLLKQF